MKTIHAADLFCGAGGTSTGLSEACRGRGFKLDLVAVNHWPLAVQTHRLNHPTARCIRASLVDQPPDPGQLLGIDSIDPRKAVPGGRLDVLVASPECMHHSVARGGRPINDQSRATAWCVLRWADALQPKAVLIENVPEFRTWGPLGSNNRPLKSRRGETYAAFLNALRSLGYTVEDRVLCAADYGDPTTRRRLFVMALRGRKAIRWPEPTHARGGENGLEAWRPARDIIDWSIPGKSIFGRKRPLAKPTMERIAAGIRKFWGPHAEPFLVMLYGNRYVRSVDAPVPTVTTSKAHIALCQPFLVAYHNGRDADRRHRSIDQPMPTLDCSNRFGLCEPFILPPEGFYRGNAPRSVDEPLQTVTASRGGGHLVEPFLVEFYGNGKPRQLEAPLGTVTCKDRFGLVNPTARLDILFRMLSPRELARAMGFADTYQFAGSDDEQVRQIGGAVPVHLATELGGCLVSACA